jgi:hypothetical protein
MRTFLFLITLTFCFNLSVFGQAKNDIKSVLTNIIDLSKAKKYDEAAKYIAFCTDEKKKEYKASVPGNKEQFNHVKRIAKRISAFTEVSTSYNVGSVTSEKIGTNDFQNVTVEFLSGTQKINSTFRFLSVGGTLLLTEIE